MPQWKASCIHSVVCSYMCQWRSAAGKGSGNCKEPFPTVSSMTEPFPAAGAFPCDQKDSSSGDVAGLYTAKSRTIEKGGIAWACREWCRVRTHRIQACLYSTRLSSASLSPLLFKHAKGVCSVYTPHAAIKSVQCRHAFRLPSAFSLGQEWGGSSLISKWWVSHTFT